MTRRLAIAAAVPLMACSPSLRRPLQTTDAATRLEQVTRSGANEFDPAVSPDASAIAYDVAAAPDAAPHVEVMSLEGAGSPMPGRVEYSSGEVTGAEPAWLPDGSGLLFSSASRRSTRLVDVARVGPGPAASYVDTGHIDFGGAWPAVSPDGASVAMSMGSLWEFRTGWRATRKVSDALGVLGLGRDRRTAGVPGLVGTGITVLGYGSEPSWSPDGTHIVFVRVTGGHTHLFVSMADGRGARQITEGPADDHEPSWSPDGRLVVFCSAHSSGRSRQANLFTVRADGSGLVQLTEGDVFSCRPSWGRDGFIYFHADATSGFHIWRIRPT